MMDEIRIIEVKQGVFEENNKDAGLLREKLKREHTFLLNLIWGITSYAKSP